jgi:hypothetical protein
MSGAAPMAPRRHGTSPGDVLGSSTSDVLGNGPGDDLLDDHREGPSDCPREGLGNGGAVGAVP